MRLYTVPIWKKAPFVRLLLPLIAGILLQWYLQFELMQIIITAVSFLLALLAFQLLPIRLRFKMQMLAGVAH